MKVLFFLIIVILLIGVWSIAVEPYILTVRYLTVEDESLKGLRVLFASDLHYKRYEKFRLKRDIEKINAQKADIILLGGDFVNGHKKGQGLNIEIIAEELGKLKSKYGTYTVLGNHDVWQGAAEITEALTKHGITVLKNSNKKAGSVYIAGVEDLQTQTPDVEKALKGTKPPVILLTHTPDIIEEVPLSVNLTLAGHLHGGQIRLPVIGAVVAPSKYGTKYAYGFFVVKGRKLFVSKGIGTSILPVRLFCMPEIVLIEFI